MLPEKYKAHTNMDGKVPKMFEHHHDKLLPRNLFLKRLAKYALISLGLVFASLLIGMAGYHIFEGYSWVDSFLNAAMLMGGNGPRRHVANGCGKSVRGNICIILRINRVGSYRDFRCSNLA